MTCLLVDDNKLARITLRQLLSNIKTIEIKGECESAAEAYTFLKANPVDLLFLDVEMPEMTGIELTRALTEKPLIIFTTTQKKYAVEAFELSVADYLIKPFTLPRLLQAVEKAEQIFNSKHTVVDNISSDVLFIKEGKTIRRISWSDILWIEAMGDYVKIKVPGKYFIIHDSMRNLEEKLDGNVFARVHRSYIIAIPKIESIEDGSITIHDTPIPLADTYKSSLLKKLKIA